MYFFSFLLNIHEPKIIIFAKDLLKRFLYCINLIIIY